MLLNLFLLDVRVELVTVFLSVCSWVLMRVRRLPSASLFCYNSNAGKSVLWSLGTFRKDTESPHLVPEFGLSLHARVGNISPPLDDL